MKNKIISISFCILLITFSAVNFIVKDKDVSTSERRYLEKFPTYSLQGMMDRSYMEKLENYSLDQFVLRDKFRTLKAKINYNILSKLDNNGIYLKNNHIFKTEYPTNTKSIDNFIKKTNNIIELLNKNNKVYYSIIPDKNYYIDDKLFLNIDYELLYDKVKENINNNSNSNNLNVNYIEIRDLLALDNYYETDTHWKQEKLSDVVNKLSEEMNFIVEDTNFNEVKEDFYGVYYGQSALNRKPETITLLTNETINNAKVKYLENEGTESVYTYEKLESFDKYEVFLNGASSFIEITNPLSKSKKELVIFRDSYASSIVPLLISSYSKITLIDTRYISSEYFLDLIEFTDQDVLFLYSTLMVNNSVTLKD